MSNRAASVRLTGLVTARGLAAGPVFISRGAGRLQIPEYVVPFGRESEELQRMERARAEVKRDLESLVAVLRERTGREDVMVFECHLMILEDPLLTEETNRNVMAAHLNAEAALCRCVEKTREQFSRMNDPYFRERVRDLDDVERRLLNALAGRSGDARIELKAPSIIVADDLTPSETVQLPRELVLGFATNGGSPTSHVALLARALGIPAVTGLGDITERVRPGDKLLLDGNAGAVIVNPSVEEVRDFDAQLAHQQAVEETDRGDIPAGTLRAGGEVLLYANLHPGVPTEGVKELGARGIGLYRSEYLWLNRELEPTEEEQFKAYREAAEFSATLGPESSITIRMLDIGGDKLVRGISTKEANPFLGNRSIRYLLSHPETMRTQLRAILRASVFGRVALMFPMISCVEELKASLELLDEEKARLDGEGIAYAKDIPVGVMIEVPAAALNARTLAKYVKFFSIGTNDLVQYTMAVDRGNEAVANLYQPVNPAVLALMRGTIAAAREAGIYVGVCGESAADPVVGILWAAMGVDILSMSATYMPVIARVLRRLSRDDLDQYAAYVERLPADMTGAEVAAACRAWLKGRVSELDEILV